MSRITINRETYLGDGLYARFDGYQIDLRAPRETGDDHCYLDPTVAQNLRLFIQDCWTPGNVDGLQLQAQPEEKSEDV